MFFLKTLIQCFLQILISLFFCTCIILFHEVIEVNSYVWEEDYVIPRSGLCVNGSKSCVHQISDFNGTEESCMMIYRPKLDPVCGYESFQEGEVDAGEEFGRMSLRSYVFRQNSLLGSFPSFNVTFYNIKWTQVYMRFIENQVKSPSLCREFSLLPAPVLSSSFTLYFDCLWNYSIEHKAFHFEYKAFTPSGDSFLYKYLFFVPSPDQIDEKRTSVKNWTIFMVVDLSEVPDRLELRLQVAPKSLQIEGYTVEVVKTLRDNKWLVRKENLFPGDNDTELRMTLRALKFGQYVFRARPIHELCRDERDPCNISSTPYILIVEMAEPKFLTSVVVVVMLIPIVLMAYFMWKKRCDKEVPTEPTGPPKFLLIYNPVSVKHIQVMMELSKYFNKACHLQAMIDQYGISESDSKDPVLWYIDAFNTADFVGIFASPKATQEERDAVSRFSRYLHTGTIAMNELNIRLSTPGYAHCKFFSVALPDSNWETLPPKAQALKRYLLPRDLDPLLVLLGASPQCDGGQGFYKTIEMAEVALTIPTSLALPLTTTSNGILVRGAEPSTTSVAKESDPPPVLVPESPCCNTQSISDLELVSSRQNFSESSDSASSLQPEDQLNLLGTSSSSLQFKTSLTHPT